MDDSEPKSAVLVSEETYQKLARENPAPLKQDPKPEPVIAKCAHGAFPWPCPWPSCARGVSGKATTLVIIRDDGQKVRLHVKRRTVFAGSQVRFEWVPG